MMYRHTAVTAGGARVAAEKAEDDAADKLDERCAPSRTVRVERDHTIGVVKARPCDPPN